MNLLLTSTGFSNRQVYAWAEREIGKRKAQSAAVIVSAHRERAERRFTKLTHAQLGAMGVTRPFFFDFDTDPITMLADVPVIYVCGGNTFQLMALMYKHNMKDVLDKFFDRGGLYIGESAGSCVMGSAIHHLAAVRMDPDTVRFGNKPALNYVPKLILPHANGIWGDVADQQGWQNLMKIRDNAAVVWNTFEGRAKAVIMPSEEQTGVPDIS